MTKSFDKLDKTFNISAEDTVEKDINPLDIEIIPSQTKSSSDHLKSDYEYTRGNLYSMIEKGQEAINGILELAQETESPRAYEVVGQLIKSVSDTTDKLLDLQKKIKDIEENSTMKGPTNVTNALFIGSTAELSKLLKKQKK